jgi:hypothetical protein
MVRNKNNRQLPKTVARRHRRHGWIVAVLFVMLIAIAVIVLINVFKPIEFQNQPSAQKAENPVETSNPPEVKGAASETEAPSEETKSTASDGTPLRNEGEDPNLSDILTGAITFAGPSEDKLAIRLNIDQYLTAGTCRLTIASATGNTYTREAQIIPSVSSSTCDGFDIPISEIETGNYSIQVYLESAEKTGTITGEVNL